MAKDTGKGVLCTKYYSVEISGLFNGFTKNRRWYLISRLIHFYL